jgi:ABC-type antimicrobial peptide transport system permease subunit
MSQTLPQILLRVLAVLGGILLIIGLLIGIYFGAVYLGYLVSIIDHVDPQTGCPMTMISDYLSQNISQSLWICPPNCSHKDFNSFYVGCLVVGIIWLVILVPLTIGGVVVVIVSLFCVWTIARNYCLFSPPEQEIELRTVSESG